MNYLQSSVATFISIVALAAMLACSSGTAGYENDAAEETRTDIPAAKKEQQTEFHAEEEIVRKALIPDDVRSLLLKSQSIPTSCTSTPQSFAECFEASEIDLGNDDHPDLVVQAVGYAMGANVTTFYVFKGGPDGYKIVLNLPALAISFVAPESGSTLDIETGAATATSMTKLRFNFVDGKYRLADRKVE